MKKSARGSAFCFASQRSQHARTVVTRTPMKSATLPTVHCANGKHPPKAVVTQKEHERHLLRTHAKYRDSHRDGLQPGNGVAKQQLDARTTGSKKRTHDWNTTPESHTRKATQRSSNRRVEDYARRDPARRSQSAAEEEKHQDVHPLGRRSNRTVDALVAPWSRFEIPDLLMSTSSDTVPGTDNTFANEKQKPLQTSQTLCSRVHVHPPATSHDAFDISDVPCHGYWRTCVLQSYQVTLAHRHYPRLV